MKKIELVFYKTNPSEKNAGLKHVLWEVTNDTGGVNYDWGFAEWDGKAWGNIEVPDGYTAQVYSWANTVNPELLTVEKRIITR